LSVEDEPPLLEIITLLSVMDLLYFTRDRGPSETLNAAVRAVGPEAELISRWTLMGQATGHEWYRCSVCTEFRLMEPAPARSCTTNVPLMDQRCPGVMTRIKKRPVMNGRIKRWLA